MSRELCPSCRELRDMSPSVSTVIEKDEAGNPHSVSITTYHCATCHQFVRSQRENIEESPEVSKVVRTEVTCPGCKTKFPVTSEIFGIVAECSECSLEFEIKAPPGKEKNSEQGS